MPNQFETVLLIGATSGIGEELARQYHAAGKMVIISGRRAERLDRLKSELPGVEAIQVNYNLAVLSRNPSDSGLTKCADGYSGSRLHPQRDWPGIQ